ncbi:substrate-binding domain-containing protein [Oscillibacter sp.]|uniref:substrate-binding domain-containing protein n=1 Tax=Oscillibacter sp. TaxID=1945593 RepID=UPI002639C1C1|nr:substrate-binding domain-containing protein [Oscillibacter sp.]MDD3346754.1 substrate-binding domain-containing protein [Oscillibacter sp.]
MKKVAAFILALTMSLSLAACGSKGADTPEAPPPSAPAATPEATKPADEATSELLAGFDTNADGLVLGFSNSYNGNSYRQKEEELFFNLADQLKEMGVLKDYIVTESNSDNATQASQIQSLVLKGVDVIIVDPGSTTALNSAIEEAWDAGVPCVIVNDGPVTTDKCYQINFDYKGAIMPAAQYIVDRLGGKGNVLISRGIAGVESDTNFYAGMREVLDKYPDIHIVAEVYGQWTGSIAQKEISSVLPSLDQVDAVLGEGGDGYGAVMAFQAANRDIPLIIGGNRGNFMSWWAQAYKDSGYETMSWTTSPAIAAASIFVAIDVARGIEVPMSMSVDGYIITHDDMEANIDTYLNMEADDIAGELYTYDWVKNTLYTQK